MRHFHKHFLCTNEHREIIKGKFISFKLTFWVRRSVRQSRSSYEDFQMKKLLREERRQLLKPLLKPQPDRDRDWSTLIYSFPWRSGWLVFFFYDNDWFSLVYEVNSFIFIFFFDNDWYTLPLFIEEVWFSLVFLFISLEVLRQFKFVNLLFLLLRRLFCLINIYWFLINFLIFFLCFL